MGKKKDLRIKMLAATLFMVRNKRKYLTFGNYTYYGIAAVMDNHIYRAPVMIWEDAYDEIIFTTDVVWTG